MGGAWLNGAESRITLERRRGAEGHAVADERTNEMGSEGGAKGEGVGEAGFPAIKERGRREKGRTRAAWAQ